MILSLATVQKDIDKNQLYFEFFFSNEMTSYW